ncbi:DUF2487 family protein [Bacillus lacus]|uniref:DUF2487 family protein n=1 Tax=Metabacillus lacus TaxID=1983721 RepID=A0A7X2LYT9_9BACI|nr:DUF2487 family protein [Metabacillus lacus]MRX70984.1 DUF2487 family protein [Metabacillus lacus]
MKWTTKDAELYSHSKEYVDTAIMPILFAGGNPSDKAAAGEAEFVQVLSHELERQLKGRLYLYPSLPVKDAGEEAFQAAEMWHRELSVQFKHVVFLTCRREWKEEESSLRDHVIYIPPVPLEHMDQQLRDSVIRDQIQQILNILLQKWNMA